MSVVTGAYVHILGTITLFFSPAVVVTHQRVTFSMEADSGGEAVQYFPRLSKLALATRLLSKANKLKTLLCVTQKAHRRFDLVSHTQEELRRKPSPLGHNDNPLTRAAQRQGFFCPLDNYLHTHLERNNACWCSCILALAFLVVH